MASRRDAQAMLRQHAERLLRTRHVVALSVGLPDDGSGEWCVRIHVAKRPAAGSKRIPRVLKTLKEAARQLPEVRTEIVVTGVPKLHATRARMKTGYGLRVREGGSWNKGVCACIMMKDDSGLQYALTAGHVVSESLVAQTPWAGGRIPDSRNIPATDMGKHSVGRCFRCSSSARPVDLALLQLDATQSSPRPSTFVTAFRDVQKEPLQFGEELRIVRRRARGMFKTRFHPGADADGIAKLFYRTTNGVVAVIYPSIVYYPRRGKDVSGERTLLRPGDSGAAVIDRQNRLVGVHIAATTTEGSDGNAMLLGYAISANRIRSWARRMSLLIRT